MANGTNPREVFKSVRSSLTLQAVEELSSMARKHVALAQLAREFNVALSRAHIIPAGAGRWVEYVLPTKRSVFVESRSGRMSLARVPNSDIVARVHIKSGATEFTNDLKTLVFMGYVHIEGGEASLVDVIRTAPKVGLTVSDIELADAVHGSFTDRM